MGLDTPPTPLENHKAVGFLRNTGPDPLENHKAVGFLRNTGPDPLENHKAVQPAFIIGPSSAPPFKWGFPSHILIGVYRDPFCYLCFVCVSAILSYMFLDSLLVTWERAYLLALLYVMFSCVFVTFP